MSETEKLLKILKDEYMPSKIFLKAFFSGFFIKPYQLTAVSNALKAKRVSFDKKETHKVKEGNEYLCWIDAEDEKELKHLTDIFGSLHPLRHHYLRDLRYLFHQKKERSDHPILSHDLHYLIKRKKVLSLVKKGKFFINNAEDLKKLHALLFGEKEDHFSDSDNPVFMGFENGQRKVIAQSAKAKEKESEVQKAFVCAALAKEDPEIPALISELCLFQKLLRIHPFTDGNGRTMRMMLQIRLYDLDYRDIFSLSLDELVRQYRDLYLSNSDIHVLYAQKKRIIAYEDPVLYRDFVFFMLKLLIVGMKDLY